MKRATTIISTDNAPKLITAIRKPTSDKRPLPRIRREPNISQSPMDAEGDAVMMEIYHMSGSHTISRSRDAAMYLCCVSNSKRPASPDGIRDASEQDPTQNNRDNASRFKDGNAPRIECHPGIIGASKATALIWIMGSRRASDLPVHPGKCHQHAAALTALGGKPWAAVEPITA